MKGIFLIKTKYLFLAVALISILFLVAPSSACAKIPTIDLLLSGLDGVEEWVGPIAAFFVNILFVYAKALAFLSITAGILDFVIEANLKHVVVDSAMVLHGFDFISGIANMALILIFIVLAFSVILRIGSLDAKKAIPRLIIVALLLNFSLVFIGMAIDIVNIFYVTLLPPAGENLAGKIIDSLVVGGLATLVILIASLITSVVAFVVPIANVFAHVALVLAVPILILPSIINSFLQIIIFVILSLMFLLYIFIFGARIFVIQILAILSPLAFLCLILPQTKKYWDMWLKWLLEWLFVGVFLLFFLRLGFLIFEAFKEELGVGFPWLLSLGAFFTFYLFVVIYLGIVAFMGKKFMPEFAQAAIDQAKGLAAHATVGWATGGAAFKHGIAGKKTSAAGHQVEGWGKKLEEHGRSRAGEGMFKKGLHFLERKAGSTITRGGKKMAVDAEQTSKEEEEKLEEKHKKQSPEERISTMRTATRMDDKIAATMVAAKNGELQSALSRGDITEDQLAKIHSAAKAKGIGVEKNIENALPQLHEKFGVTNSGMSEEEKGKKLEELLKRTLNDPELLANMSPDAWDDQEMQPILLKLIKGRHLGKIADSGNTELQVKVEEVIEGKIQNDGFESFANENTSLATYLANTANRGGAGVRDLIHLPEQDANEILRNVRNPQPTPPPPPTPTPPPTGEPPRPSNLPQGARWVNRTRTWEDLGAGRSYDENGRDITRP